jgi:hypothetical protein
MAGSFHAIGLVFSLQYNLHDGLKQQVEQWWQSLYYHMEMQFLMITMMMVRIKIIFRSKLVRKIHGNHVLGHRDYMIHDRTLMGFPEKMSETCRWSSLFHVLNYQINPIPCACHQYHLFAGDFLGLWTQERVHIYNVRILNAVLVLVA